MINPWKVSTIALTLALGATVSLGAVRSADAEQPQMQDALASLRSAKVHLEKAAHDHGGHRTKAIEATKNAMIETELGIAWAAEHH